MIGKRLAINVYTLVARTWVHNETIDKCMTNVEMQ